MSKTNLNLLQFIGDQPTSTKDPSTQALEFFQDITPMLRQFPWDSREQDTRGRLPWSSLESDITSRHFTGNIRWVVKGSEATLLAKEPTERSRYEARIQVHAPDWRQQAELKFVRNAFSVGEFDLSKGTSRSPFFADLKALEVAAEASAPNETDRLHIMYEASSAFLPDGTLSSIERRINCAPLVTANIQTHDEVDAWKKTVRYETVRHPSDEELAALSKSTQLLTNAIRHIRSAST